MTSKVTGPDMFATTALHPKSFCWSSGSGGSLSSSSVLV